MDNVNSDILKQAFEMQTSMIVITDGREILDVNQGFLRVFDHYDTLDAFKKEYRRICDLFEVEEKYGFIYDFDDKDWITFLQSNKQKRHKVKIKLPGRRAGCLWAVRSGGQLVTRIVEFDQELEELI